ncbi:uncharacterized protein LOC141641032 [Silene latifolia]|uniref:uncharacterized protein LOC141641032 n=1 Tax=Silene latifolia TaxID=37657 RepID=UPI003D7769E2
MIITAWNIRGLNDPLKQQEAQHFLLVNKVDCGALIETHVKHKAIKDVSTNFSGYNLVHNNDSHYNGWIWIFWKPNILSLTVLHKYAQHMHCLLLYTASQKFIEVTFVYAFNARLDRRELWKQLNNISSQERLGSSDVQLADSNEFKNCLDACSLVDHPSTRCHFTWNYKLLEWAKLDRVLASPQWLTNIHSTIAYLNAVVSDHSPCLGNIVDMPTSRKSSFKYLNCWALSPQFQDNVKEGWSNHYYGNHIATLFPKLKKLRGSLRRIHTSIFTNLSARVAEGKQALQQCQDQLNCSPIDLTLIAMEKTLLKDYLMVKRAEMQVLYQRAKVQNLQLNDVSTRFFYSRLADRRARNSIGIIQDENGKLCTGFKEVSQGFISYYKTLFGTSSLVLPLLTSVFLQDAIPSDCYNPLVQHVRVHEIIDALKSIDRHKSPGIDGYSSGFFLDAWHLVGLDFKTAVF